MHMIDMYVFSAHQCTEYEKTGKELVAALRTSLSEQGNNTRDDTAIRRAADPARELIQRLLARGSERDGRGETRSFAIFTSVVRDLGAFYRERGPRATLDETLRLDILSRLDEAENLLAEHL